MFNNVVAVRAKGSLQSVGPVYLGPKGAIMNKTIKGALCGFVIGVGITLALGASTTSTPPGRFQITSGANYMAVIDTVTGQVWAGNFNQLGPGGAAIEFRTCPQGSGDFFKPKAE